MSVSNISDTSVDHSQKQAWDILADHNGIKIDDKFVLKLTKGSRNVNREVKNSCKVFHFSSEWNFEEIFSKIHGLELKDYPQLFIFVIDGIKEDLKSTNGSPDKKLKRECDVNKLIVVLQKFESARPIILQMTNEDDDKTQIYYKDYNVDQFLSLYRKQNNFAKVEDFSIFLCSFLTGNSDISGENRFKFISDITNSSFILKFLRTLNLRDSFMGEIILEVAYDGTKASFIAALDAPFDSDGRILGIRDQKYISDVFGDNKNSDNDDSVCSTAIRYENTEVINFLIFNWTHLIQQLPFDHQAIISTDAFKTNQINVLCNLLNIADYPFPKDFKIDSDNLEILSEITAERNDFKHAIETENFMKIHEFATKNRNLKLVYNPSNKSALTEAVDSKRYAVFYYLKSLGFEGAKSDEILANLSEEEKDSAKTQAEQQKNINVNKSRKHIHRSVHKLFVQSFIHDRRTSKEKEAEYWPKIMQWYTEVNEIAPKLLEVAASCDDLKIFFDFESDSVDSIDPEYSNSLGLTYEKRKWIFIGAEFKTKEREQQIKGVIAHELCHYAMFLVYNNKLLPYYKNAENIRIEFDGIVTEMDKWSQSGSNETDDECNKIISSVFTDYRKEKHHLELIVRPVHILVEFHDKNYNEKSNDLEKKYENLFNFWTNRVLHDLQEYCNKNLDIVKLNRIYKFLPDILKSKIDINCMKIEETLIASKLAIVTTNIPKLLFINIRNYLQNSFGSLLDSKNFFIEPNKVDILEHENDFFNMCKNALDLNIFVDCTKGDVSQSLEHIFVNKKLNFIFVVSNDQQSAKLMTIFKKKNMMNHTENKINYNWNDLTQKSQNLLLKTRIDFQNNSQVSLMDLLKSENTTGTQDLSEIIEDQMLYLLTENQKISINTKLENELNEEKFIFKTRRFRVKQKDANNKNEDVPEISQEELLLNIKNKQYVLISDQAGNGKSWAMKNFTKILREQNPTSWVTYVDLKLFIDEFKDQEDEPEFSTFMIEKIFKLQQNFEEKVFQKFYNNGKVFILFDGFDEIAPDCAEFVSKLAQNFQSNGGNQLWIATRDYFEVDLMEKLKLNVAYGLVEMTEIEGIELITRSWVFMSLKDKNVPKSRVEFDEVIKSSTEYKNYQLKALELVKKVTINWNRSIGLPLLLKLVAGLKYEKYVDRLTKSEIFTKFIKSLYKRWSDDGGQIRKNASINSQEYDMPFWKFHQYHAILSLFPELAPILFPRYDGSKWKNEEIIACGILIIKNEKIYFIHETFREYFVADFIWKKILEIDEKVLELFVKILTVEKFGVIRMFLNDMIVNDSILSEIQPKVQIYVAKFNKMTSFYDFFTSNLKNLVDLVFGVLKTGDYEQVLGILWKNVLSIAEGTKDSEIFQKFQEFIFGYLEVNDLKELIIQLKVLQLIIRSSLEIEMFEDFVIKMEAKTDQEFTREALMSGDGFNIFYSLSSSSYISDHKVQKILEIVKKYLTVDEIFKLMSNCDGRGSVFQTLVRIGNKEDLKILWTGIENYFTTREIHQKFKELVKQHEKNGENILLLFLDNADIDDSIDFYKTLWELLLKTFKDREELKDIVLQKDIEGFNFVYKLMRRDINQAILEWTFKILKETFTNTQFQEILQFKGWNEMNLLQVVVIFLSSEVIKILWNIFQDLCETNEEFLKMLKKFDENGRNIFHMVVSHSSSEFFEFMIQELEKIASRDKIKEILSQPTSGNRNLLQLAALWNKSLELHKSLWKTIREYCEESEITHFITNVDIFGNNLLFNAVIRNTKEIKELTWNEIKKNLNHDRQVQYLKIKGKCGENLIQYSNQNINKSVTEWVENLIKEYGIE